MSEGNIVLLCCSLSPLPTRRRQPCPPAPDPCRASHPTLTGTDACLHLQGAPYGYTPFCDNNKDMDGFRFWRQGFWKDHLRGKPYHISALYVVDLARFRSVMSILYAEPVSRFFV